MRDIKRIPSWEISCIIERFYRKDNYEIVYKVRDKE